MVADYAAYLINALLMIVLATRPIHPTPDPQILVLVVDFLNVL